MNLYTVHVPYEPIRGTNREYEERFSEIDRYQTVYHSSCSNIDQTARERIFRIAEMPQAFLRRPFGAIRDELAHAYPGFRFAIECEAEPFAVLHRELRSERWIYALGSLTRFGRGDWYVAALEHDLKKNHGLLRGPWLALAPCSDDRLLLVQE